MYAELDSENGLKPFANGPVGVGDERHLARLRAGRRVRPRATAGSQHERELPRAGRPRSEPHLGQTFFAWLFLSPTYRCSSCGLRRFRSARSCVAGLGHHLQLLHSIGLRDACRLVARSAARLAVPIGSTVRSRSSQHAAQCVAVDTELRRALSRHRCPWRADSGDGSDTRSAGRSGSGSRPALAWPGALACAEASGSGAAETSSCVYGCAGDCVIVLGRAGLEHLAGVHHEEPLGEVPGRGDVVGDVEQCQVVLGRRARQAGSEMLSRTETSSIETGSSATRTFGCTARVRAIATRWRWPPDSSCGSLSITWSAGVRCTSRAARARGRRSSLFGRSQLVDPQRPLEVIRDGVHGVERRVGILEDQLNLAAVALAGRPPLQIRRGARETAPARGRWLEVRATTRPAVDLPEPLSPTSATHVPAIELEARCRRRRARSGAGACGPRSLRRGPGSAW